MKPDISHLEYLPEDGSPETGWFKVRSTAKWAGTVVGEGYRSIQINKKQYREHRLIYQIVYGHLPVVIDHIDHNRLNNVPSNLRASTVQNNNRNRPKMDCNKSGFVGVFLNKYGSYVASIRQAGRTRYLGSYKCPIDAALVYDSVAERVHGNFAVLNFQEVI